MNAKKLRGDWGEAFVAAYLRKKGYEIIASQFRCRMGEIDLIAKQNDVLCFVEVKTRTRTEYGLPREFVGTKKQQRIRAAASMYLVQNELDCPMRFDVAEVYTDDTLNEKNTKIEYLEAAFE